MPKTFENLVVVTPSGKIIFEKVKEQEEFEPEPFRDMIVAFNALIEEMAAGKLSNIEWGDKTISIKKKDNILFVGCCSLNTKDKKIQDDFDYIVTRFSDLYSKVLIEEFEKTGERSIFENTEKWFESQIKDYMK